MVVRWPAEAAEPETGACGGPVVVGEVFLGEGIVGEERDEGDGCGVG